MKKFLLKSWLTMLCLLVFGVGSAWAEDFSTTYSYGLSGWSLTNYTDQSSYYQVPTGTDVTTSVATISGIFSGKTITSDVVVTINCATYGSGTNPSASTFSLYKETACTNAITATQGGTLPTDKSYTNVIYTITQANAASLNGDLAIKITKPGKTIRLNSIKIEFTYTSNGDQGGDTGDSGDTGGNQGGETPSRPANEIFYESFDKCNGTGGNSGGWSGNIASTTLKSELYDNAGWTFGTAYAADKCVRMGASSSLGSAETPAINATGNLILTFKAGAWSGKSKNLKLSATGATLDKSFVTMADASFTEFTVNISNATAGFKIKFEGNTAKDSQFFLDEVSIIVVPTYTYDEFVAKRESLTENDIFNVTLEDITIVGTYDATGAGGYMVTISKDGYLQIPIYAPAPTPAKEWTVGGTLSGTLTNVIWGGNGTTISSEDVSIWDNLTYKPIQTYTLDQLFGTPSKDYVNVEVDDVVESCMTDVPGTYSVMFKNSGVSLIIHTDNLEWVAGGTVKGTLNNVQWRGDNNTIYGRAYDYWEALTYVPTFASLAELLNADLEDGTVVTVSFDNEIFYLNYDEEEESATVVLNEGDNFVGLMAYGAYDTDWQEGGKLAGTWENVYYAKQLGNVYLMSDSETPWEDVNYTAPAVATISLNAACHDEDGMVYGTYSNSSAWIVPADLIVSEISIIDGQLYVESYDEGDVVPANTGVMVSAEEGGNYQVVIASELMSMFAESVLGADNCLRPSGDDGISADAMAANDANCIYYRLTMHNGTQIGYWWGAAEGAAFSLAANKAYLAVPKDAAAKMAGLWIDDEATLVDAINISKKENDVMYNLNGQRVNANAKGIVIVNGKKMLNN